MMRNSIKHEKLVRKNDMKWHPWNIMFHMDVSSGWTFDWFDPHLQHHCFLASGHEACCQEQPLDPFENTWEAAVSRTFQWLRPSLQLKGRCLEVKFLWSILGWRHPNKNSASFQINKCNSFVHFAVRGAWYRRTLDGSYNTWMHRITHTSTLLKRLHLVVSWGLWNLETCQRDCVFSTRIWALPTKSFWILLSWIDIWQSGEIDAMTPCLFVLGPRCSPRWRTQVAIILLTILNDDVMVMGILYPGRLEVCCAENCLSYRDRRLKKMNVFNTWTWTLQNDKNDSALNFMPKRLKKDLGFPAKSDSTKCWHLVGFFDLKFPFH